jgi:hypothetical protein
MNDSPRVRHWPLAATLTIFGATMAAYLVLSLRLTRGHLTYPLDDAYIQMAMAKNFVLHNTWGVTSHGFSSSSSSALWTLLIAGIYSLFGVNEVAPFILSLLFGTVTVIVMWSVLNRHIASRRWVLAGCLLGVFLAPLPPLAFLGMEHALHAAVSLVLVWFVAGILSTNRRLSLRDAALLALLSVLVSAVRYEGLFLAFVICVLLILSRRAAAAMVVAAAAAIPPVAYGLWSVSKGGLFLPNSVLLKGSLPGLGVRGIVQTLFGYRGWTNAGKSPHLLLLLIVAAFLVVLRTWRKSSRGTSTYALTLFIGATILHLNFAQAGWLYRYDAYLVLVGLTAIIVAAWELQPELPTRLTASPRLVAAVLLLVLAASPIAVRAARFLVTLPQATKNIYEQQYQMGRFFGKFYAGRPVAVNDIGAVSYLADVRLVDLWGLADQELARLKLHNRYTDEQAIARAGQERALVAIVYHQWFSSPSWSEVGQWRIRGNVTCAHAEVSICAAVPSATAELIRNLAAFAPDLPADVEQSGPYTRR